ncbi:hypothetical protein FQA39_LY09773 [Lamprigera yunnana]|nr:hypothetical protein FQA39_LY09773 [Lamprigera yunnana]
MTQNVLEKNVAQISVTQNRARKPIKEIRPNQNIHQVRVPEEDLAATVETSNVIPSKNVKWIQALRLEDAFNVNATGV